MNLFTAFKLETYKVIVAGTRHFNNYALLSEKLEYYLSEKVKTHQVIIVSGTASGADILGCRYAAEHGLQIELHLAHWSRQGRAAGPIRNTDMAKCSDALIAFWDGKSPGTKSMIEIARLYGLRIAVVRY